MVWHNNDNGKLQQELPENHVQPTLKTRCDLGGTNRVDLVPFTLLDFATSKNCLLTILVAHIPTITISYQFTYMKLTMNQPSHLHLSPFLVENP